MRRPSIRPALLLPLGALGLAVLLGFAAPAGAQQPPPAELPAVAPTPADSTPTTLALSTPAAEPAAPPAQEQEEGDPVEEVIHEAEENGGTHADAECVEVLAEGGSVTDCQEAPNVLIPEWNEIIWGGLAFLFVFFFLAKFGLPQIKATMNQRTERIRNEIQSAEDQRSEAETVLAEYRAQLNDARSEAGRIIEEARQAADQIRRDQETSLQTELAEMRQRAVADIDAAKVQAVTDLRSDVAEIAIGAAETIVGRNLDAATQNQLVEQYIDDLAARRS